MTAYQRVKMPIGSDGAAIQAPIGDWENGQKVAVSGTSTPSTAISSTAVYIVSDATCFINIGTAPVAADSADSMLLPANQWLLLGIESGDKVAAFHGSNTGSLYIVPVKMVG